MLLVLVLLYWYFEIVATKAIEFHFLILSFLCCCNLDVPDLSEWLCGGSRL